MCWACSRFSTVHPRVRAAKSSGLGTMVTNLIIAESQHEAIEEQFFWPRSARLLKTVMNWPIRQFNRSRRESSCCSGWRTGNPVSPTIRRRYSQFVNAAREHIAFEQQEVWPLLEAAVSHEELVKMGEKLETAKKARPDSSSPGHAAQLAPAQNSGPDGGDARPPARLLMTIAETLPAATPGEPVGLLVGGDRITNSSGAFHQHIDPATGRQRNDRARRRRRDRSRRRLSQSGATGVDCADGGQAPRPDDRPRRRSTRTPRRTRRAQRARLRGADFIRGQRHPSGTVPAPLCRVCRQTARHQHTGQRLVRRQPRGA